MDVQSSQSLGKISSIDPVKEYQANLLDYVMSSGNTSDPEFNRWLDWYIESFFKKNYGEDRAKQLLADPVTKPSYRKYFTEQVLSRGANFEPVMRTPEQIESIRQQVVFGFGPIMILFYVEVIVKKTNTPRYSNI